MKKHSISFSLAMVIATLVIFSFPACDAGNSDPAPVAVSGVTLDHNVLTLEVGDYQLLKFTIIPSTADNKKVTWKSNAEDVATVSTSGRVTGVSAGSAIITVTTDDGNKPAVCRVTVTNPNADPAAVTGVTLDQTTLTINKGNSALLHATVNPSTAANKNVTWESSAPTIAAVTSGAVTGVSKGNATITVKTEDGNFTAACTVTVTDPNEEPDFNEEPLVNFNIHFLELGNKYTGDCVYINYGDMDILIDAGSRQASATTIIEYINNHIQDNKLEYVIATHAHEDHIAGFYTNGTTTGVFDAFEIGTIIDFPNTDNTTTSPTSVYNRYISARTAAINRGAVHYTALQCFNETDGAQRIYDLGNDIKLEILYNYYYDHNVPSSGTENDYSVCLRIIQGENQYLFTGDLESPGEGRLVDHYAANGGLGHVVLWKGGHHGSQTSASQKLMSAITPDYIVICTCVGTPQYGANPQNIFPAQSFINQIAPHTDKVYATTLITDYDNNRYESFNGNVTFSVAEDHTITITGSNNDLKLKETEWFLANRIMPNAWK